ncbi:Nanos-type domain-containing protein [Trichostrongylus colubriformis]|uniref:Nanos-type domain-containing protein n=1 Tax=Trichostrongylus colubriformis TaxID=6319 RepID=A0AAN8IV26_TRICO
MNGLAWTEHVNVNPQTIADAKMVEVREIPNYTSCNHDTMYSKVQLELKKKTDSGKIAVDTAVGKGRKADPDFKKLSSGARRQDVNLMFTECWQQYSDYNVSPVARTSADKPAKELLQYCGKRSCSSWDSSDASSSSHYDETELCSQGTESTTSDFFSGSDHATNDADFRNDLSPSPNQESPPSFASGLRSPRQAFQGTKQNRYCWYCYDVYSAMCLAQGKTVPDIHNRGLWRGHCMKDAHGFTTCPHLWFTTCTHCGATADTAHSPEFCPMVKLTSLSLQDK